MTTTPDAVATTGHRLLVVRALLPVVAGSFPPFLTGALAVQLSAELGFSESGLGLAVAAFFFASSTSSIAFGRAADRFGAARAMRLGALTSAVCMATVAIFATSLPSLIAPLLLGGLGNALTQPAANLYLARAIRPERHGLAFSIKQSAIPIATMLAGLAVPVFALTIGWRWAYAAGACAAVLAAAGVGRLDARGRRPDDGAAPDSSWSTLVAFTTGIGFGAAAAGALGTFLVSTAVAAGMASGPAGLLFSGGSLCGIVARITLGHRADRSGGDQMRVVTFQLLAGAVAFAMLGSGSQPVILAMTPLAFAAGWGWPGLFNLAIVRANPHGPGRATGITQTGTYLGAMLGPLVFGTIVELFSYRVGWAVAAVLALLGAAAVTAGRRIARTGAAGTGAAGSLSVAPP